MKLIRLTKDTIIKSFDYGTETNESEEYPFMTSREEEYARTGNAVDFLEMMADFKNEFEW